MKDGVLHNNRDKKRRIREGGRVTGIITMSHFFLLDYTSYAARILGGYCRLMIRALGCMTPHADMGPRRTHLALRKRLSNPASQVCSYERK